MDNPKLSSDLRNILGDDALTMLADAASQQNDIQFKAILASSIAQIDKLLSEQLSDVIQHKEFKALESSWSGLYGLCNLPVSQRRIKIKLLDMSWNRLSTDLNLSFDLKRSTLYKKVYMQELDTAGGNPFGMLVVDHKVSVDFSDQQDFDDLYTLQLISELGERALCPVLLGVNPHFFGDDQSRQLHDSARIKRILDSRDFQSWQLLRASESSRFLHLVLPEYFQRTAWNNCAAGFVFNEKHNEQSTLWGNSVYLLAGNVLREFDRISWFGFLRAYDEFGSYGAIVPEFAGQEITGRVEIFSEDDGFWAEQGFVPLSSLYLTEQNGFFSNQSVWHAPNESSRLLGMLQTNLMACRFGHYIKAQIRDQLGSYHSADDCRRSLEKWLRNYISEVDYGEDAVMARYPLKSCNIDLVEDPQDKTRYLCKITLQPQYQYEILDAHIVLATSVSDKEVGEAA